MRASPSEVLVLRSRFVQYAVVTAFVVGAIGASELALRMLMRYAGYAPLDWYLEPHLALGKAMAPGAPGHDARGYRNPEVREKARILFIGDSQVHGYGVPVNANFPHLVEELSGEATYNVSLGGYSPPEYRYLYREVGRSLEPDKVVVAFSIGTDVAEASTVGDRLTALGLDRDALRDAAPRARQLRELYAEVIKEHLPLVGRIDFGLRNVKLYSLVTRLADFYPTNQVEYYQQWEAELRSAREELSPDGRWLVDEGFWVPHSDERFHTIFMPLWRVLNLLTTAPDTMAGLELCQKTLVSLARDVRTDGAEMWVLLIPSKESVYHSYLTSTGVALPQSFLDLEFQTKAVVDAVSSALRAEGVPIIDPTPQLSEQATAGRLVYSDDHDGHLNAEGHAIVARVVTAALGGSASPGAAQR